MGRVAAKYKRRVAVARSESGKTRSLVGRVLVRALQSATDQELYRITKLPVTHRMYRSIQIFYFGAYDVAAGYNLAKAAYAKARVNMKGVSKLGGHRLDMNPAPIIREEADNKIARIIRAAQRRIIGGS